MGMTDDEVAARCHANCIEYSRVGARLAGASGAIQERDGVTLFASGSDFPVIANGAFRTDGRTAADRVIDLADEWFAARGTGWSLGTSSWAGQDQDLLDAASSRGLLPVTDTPAMICTDRLAEAVAPPGIELRVLRTDAEAAAYIAMSDRAYTSLGMPAGVIEAMAPAPVRVPPHVTSVAAFEDDRLLAGAQVMFSHGIAGVYLVGTAEEARGRGLAELVTRAVTNIGFDGGAPLVTLQASPMGEPIYRRMGFIEIYRYVNHARFV